MGSRAFRSSDIPYASGCYRVAAGGRYVVYSQLTYRCKHEPRAILYVRHAVYVTKQAAVEPKEFQLLDERIVVHAENPEHRFCYASRLFAMVSLDQGNFVCVKASHHDCIERRQDKSFFGIYRHQ